MTNRPYKNNIEYYDLQSDARFVFPIQLKFKNKGEF